jgi:hypothetical protein
MPGTIPFLPFSAWWWSCCNYSSSQAPSLPKESAHHCRKGLKGGALDGRVNTSLLNGPQIGLRKKAWKPNKKLRRMVLGADVGLQETCRLAMCGLVGRLSYAYLSDCSVSAWMQKTWKPILGYLPEIHYLMKGWIGFICRTPEDATLLLDRFWLLGGSTLMLKRWRVAFDPTTDYFQRRHLWVLLPALPLHLWNEGALKAIGNALGHCITLDFSSLAAPARKMGRIMVEIDIHEGLPEVLDIEWRGHHIKQRLDYQGISFRCNWCHCTGHLRRDCPGKVLRKSLKISWSRKIPQLIWMKMHHWGSSLPSLQLHLSTFQNPQAHFQVRLNNTSLHSFIHYLSGKRK